MSKPKLPVAHFIATLAMGGAERFLLELLQELQKHSNLKTFLVLLRDDERFYLEYSVPDYLSLEFDTCWRDWGEIIRAVRQLRRFLQQNEIRILHTHLWITDFIGALAVRGTRVRHVSHIHNTLNWYASARLGFRFRRFLFRQALRAAGTTFIGCSRAATDYSQKWLEFSQERFVTIPYGIDVARFAPAPNPPSGSSTNGMTRIGMAGRMVPTKGHHVLLEAISKARSQLPPFELNIAGDGPCRREIEEKVSALGLDNVVRTRGSLSDMPAFYRGMDVVVQPSLSEEGLPLAILEALATGVPVIASDVAGAREVITPGVNGFLFRPGDPDGLAQHLIRFVTLSAQSRGSMSWSATARIRASCSREVVADAVLRRYDSLLEAE